MVCFFAPIIQLIVSANLLILIVYLSIQEVPLFTIWSLLAFRYCEKLGVKSKKCMNLVALLFFFPFKPRQKSGEKNITTIDPLLNFSLLKTKQLKIKQDKRNRQVVLLHYITATGNQKSVATIYTPHPHCHKELWLSTTRYIPHPRPI